LREGEEGRGESEKEVKVNVITMLDPHAFKLLNEMTHFPQLSTNIIPLEATVQHHTVNFKQVKNMVK
jgi:hypothetical protein